MLFLYGVAVYVRSRLLALTAGLLIVYFVIALTIIIVLLVLAAGAPAGAIRAREHSDALLYSGVLLLVAAIWDLLLVVMAWVIVERLINLRTDDPSQVGA